MSTHHLLTLDAPVTADDVTKFLPHLENALAGTGPAVHALPRDKPSQRSVGSRPLEFDDIAVVVSTSGTSGKPKLAMLSRSAITASVAATHEALGGPGRWLLMVPISHIAGVQVLTRSIMAGYSPTVLDLSTGFQIEGFVAAVDKLLGAAGSERRYTSLVPTQLRRLLDAGADAVAQLVAFDAVLLGGAAPPPALIEHAEAAGINIVESYGMTETSAGCVYDGMPLTGVKVTLGASDRIEIRGPVIFSGYRGEPELSRIALVDGALVTNDFGGFDDKGRLLVLGRLDDVVITGGLNASCSSVERAMCTIESIREVVVVGVPDEEWGQALVAVAVVDDGFDWAREQVQLQEVLDRHEVPKRVMFVPALPLLPSGKPDRVTIADLARQPQ